MAARSLQRHGRFSAKGGSEQRILCPDGIAPGRQAPFEYGTRAPDQRFRRKRRFSMRGSFEFKLGRNHFLRSELRIGFNGKETVMDRMGFFVGRKPITPGRVFLGHTGLRDFKLFDFSGLQINADAEWSEGNIRKSFRQCGTEFALGGDGLCLSFSDFSALTDNEPNVCPMTSGGGTSSSAGFS